MFKGIQKIINSNSGKYIISILLGLGLSTLFRNACNDRKCIVFKAVTPENVRDKIFRIDNNCYKYTERQVKCQNNNNTTELTF